MDKLQKGGRYELSWDGKDERGTEVGSGIYFCRLEVRGLKAESPKLKAESRKVRRIRVNCACRS